MAASTDYRHQPLENSRQQIRLLTILPAKDDESPIFTHLTSHSMPSSNASRSERLRAHLQLPAYMAVSYVCGSGQDLVKTHQIFVDGKRFPVTANVHAAFQVYRAYTTTSFRGWIDCICISQTDDAEKSQQILLMREIYFHAVAVLVWLGRATPDSDRALKFINKLALHPLFTKASDAILELPKLEADEKLKGVRPSISEQIRRTTLRQGYAGIMNAAFPVLRAVNIAGDVVLNKSRSDKLSQAAKATSQDDFQTPYPTTASIVSFQSAFQTSLQEGWQEGKQRETVKKHPPMPSRQAINVALSERKDINYNAMGLWTRNKEFRREWNRLAAERRAWGSHSEPERAETGQSERSQRVLAERPLPMPSVQAINAGLGARKDIDYNAMSLWARQTEFRREWNRLAAERRLARVYYKYSNLNSGQDEVQDDAVAVLRRPKARTTTQWEPNSAALASVADEDFTEMAQLIERTLMHETQYFNRMWTLQEPCVGVSVTAQRGTSQVEFRSLLNVINYLNRTLHSNVIDKEKVNQLQWLNSAFRRGRRLPLQVLVYESRSRKCYDPRDRIYALSGLMAESPNILVEPNYQRSIPEVYAHAARFMIASGASLDIIASRSSLQPDTAIDHLPSWVPNFRNFGHATDTTSLVDFSRRCNIYHASATEHCALASDLAKLTELPQPWNILSVTGSHIANICKISPRDIDSADIDIQEIEKAWNHTIITTKAWSSDTLQHLLLASELLSLYCSLSGSTTHVKNPSQAPSLNERLASLTATFHDLPDESHRLLVQYLQAMLCGRLTPTSRCDIDKLEELMSTACVRDAEGTGDLALEMLYEAFMMGMLGRRVAVLGPEDRATQWLAVVPEEAQVRDLVCVIDGCSVPVVLREDAVADQMRYTIVGECYVTGFMDGEAVILRNEPEYQRMETCEFDLI